MDADYRHQIPLRWADLDVLNHVNNVVYLEYAAQAERALVDAGTLPLRRPGSVTVEFLRPVQLGRRPVEVVSRPSDDALVQQIGVLGVERVFARVTSSYAEPPPSAPAADVTATSLALRPSDLDAAGVVTVPKVFELLQESRIPYMATLLPSAPGGVVLAQVTVDLPRPIASVDEVESRVWVDRVGTSSYAIGAQLVAGGAVAVSSLAVLVGFDPATQRSRPLTDDERAGVRAGLRSST